jgi:triosephosphate isomerase
MSRKPLALANWKMAMTVAESLAFVQSLHQSAGDMLNQLDSIICPPYTAIWPLAQELQRLSSPIVLGGQNIAPSDDPAQAGGISAPLLADAGCRRVMLGHWEVRRAMHEDDTVVNRKVQLALAADLWPIVFLGEGREEYGTVEAILHQRIATILQGCTAAQVATMVMVYEPEGAIGLATPVSPQHAQAGCQIIREAVRATWGDVAAEAVRIIYGGSVSPDYAAELLVCMDGLGATRRGREVASFLEIMRQIVQVKGMRDLNV